MKSSFTPGASHAVPDDAAGSLSALLLTKPANMFYLTGDGRLCAYAMITQDSR